MPGTLSALGQAIRQGSFSDRLQGKLFLAVGKSDNPGLAPGVSDFLDKPDPALRSQAAIRMLARQEENHPQLRSELQGLLNKESDPKNLETLLAAIYR